jgi:hypothetical protein
VESKSPALSRGRWQSDDTTFQPTFTLDGKQYIAFYSGYGGDARGMQGGLNRAFPGEFPEVPEGGAVWLFGLE